MKTIIIILLLSFGANKEVVPVIQDKYCEGFEDGFKEGWCYERWGCLAPLPPLCPLPEIECEKGYKCGYNRGFVLALNKRDEE